MEPAADDLLDIDEVSALTGIPVATLRYWRHLGTEGPKSFKLGRHVKYTRADVRAWIARARDAENSDQNRT